MSLEYAEKRIAEALTLSKGNQARACRQLMSWALNEDTELLQSLTKAHLSGIVFYNVERVASGRAAAAKKKATAPKPANKSNPKAEEDFGMELLKAVASSSSEVFGLEHNAPLGRKGQVSQNHINAIRAMASNKNSDTES